MEEFRKLCYETYGLDPVHHFISSHLSGDAFIKTFNAEIELLTDREHIEMTENMIRGGVSSKYSQPNTSTKTSLEKSRHWTSLLMLTIFTVELWKIDHCH